MKRNKILVEDFVYCSGEGGDIFKVIKIENYKALIDNGDGLRFYEGLHKLTKITHEVKTVVSTRYYLA